MKTITEFEGEIVRWVDGDTVIIHVWHEEVTEFEAFGITHTDTHRVDKTERYRLIIIDTPEKGEPGYKEAAQYATNWLPPGALCRVLTHGNEDGAFGRTLADVFPGNVSTTGMSEKMLRDGFAKVWTKKR